MRGRTVMRPGGAQIDDDVLGVEQLAELIGRRQRGQGDGLAIGAEVHDDAVLQVQRPAAPADPLGHLETFSDAREAHDQLQQRLRLLRGASARQARQAALWRRT